MTVVERFTGLTEDDLKKHAGRWVAVRDGHVLVTADDPALVAKWLSDNKKAADLVYRIPAANEPASYY